MVELNCADFLNASWYVQKKTWEMINTFVVLVYMKYSGFFLIFILKVLVVRENTISKLVQIKTIKLGIYWFIIGLLV